MDNKNHDNSYELYSRTHPTRNVSTSNNGRNDGTEQPNSISTDANRVNSARSSRRPTDDYDSSPISIIDANRPPSTRPPSVEKKQSRRVSVKSDVSNKSNRAKDRSTLTSSFLKRKRNEYAGTNYF